MATRPHRLTADDVLRIPVTEPGVVGYELVNGELVPVSPNDPPHGRIALELGSALLRFVKEHGAGRVYTEAGYVSSVPGDSERQRTVTSRQELLPRKRSMPGTPKRPRCDGGASQRGVEGSPSLQRVLTGNVAG